MSGKIIVAGSNGQLGNCLRDIASQWSQYRFVFTDIAELDITNSEAVAAFFDIEKPDWVINAAAYTAVDKAESEPEVARLINATAVGILASQAARVGSGLVHISTDYVFDGASQVILSEDMPTNPVSVYGQTKLDGEQEARRNNRHVILRTSWLYSVYGNNFVKTMRRLGAERDQISVVADQWGSPTSADDLAVAIMTVIERADTGADIYGTYHFSNEGATSWADFATTIMELSALECRVEGITTDQYPTPVRRPSFSLMSKAKFSSVFGVNIPDWEASLEKVIERLSKDTLVE